MAHHNSEGELFQMTNNITTEINHSEEQLRLAMLASDVQALDALIAPDLVFTTHFGSVITKQEDLAAHQSGTLKFHSIVLSEQRILALGAAVYVSVRAKVTGTYGGAPFQNDLRFSRIWQRNENSTWQIAAGHATVVQA
jgi:ketosteroid isomerase-like protein